MAIQGESNRVSIRISKETVWGETPPTGPGPTMARLPYLSDTLNHNKRTKQSNTLRSDRMKDAQVQVGVDAQGDINFELRFADFDAILECALASTFAAATFTGSGGNLDFAASSGGTQVITAPAATWDSYIVGAWVRVSGANANNNGVFKVTAKTSTDLTIANATGTLQANADGASVRQKTMRNGTTKQSLLIEKQYEDLTNNYENYRGMRVAGLSLNIQSEEIVQATVRFMGKQGYLATATVSGSLTNPSANDSMTASLNVGSIVEGGAALSTALKSISMDLNNNPRSLSGVGNVAAIGVNLGSISLTGRVEAYFEDQVLLTKVRNHTSSSLEFRLTDPQGNVFVFTLAQLKWSGNPNNPGLDQDVMLPLDFSCERQPTDNYMIQVDALAV
jgi:hypothetical protein